VDHQEIIDSIREARQAVDSAIPFKPDIAAHDTTTLRAVAFGLVLLDRLDGSLTVSETTRPPGLRAGGHGLA
jgi:hypothetical protein